MYLQCVVMNRYGGKVTTNVCVHSNVQVRHHMHMRAHEKVRYVRDH